MRIDTLKLDDIQRTRGLNNEALAHSAGISKATISHIRTRGKCSQVSGLRIARALGVSIRDIEKRGDGTHEKTC